MYTWKDQVYLKNTQSSMSLGLKYLLLFYILKCIEIVIFKHVGGEFMCKQYFFLSGKSWGCKQWLSQLLSFSPSQEGAELLNCAHAGGNGDGLPCVLSGNLGLRPGPCLLPGFLLRRIVVTREEPGVKDSRKVQVLQQSSRLTFASATRLSLLSDTHVFFRKKKKIEVCPEK